MGALVKLDGETHDFLVQIRTVLLLMWHFPESWWHLSPHYRNPHQQHSVHLAVTVSAPLVLPFSVSATVLENHLFTLGLVMTFL